MDTQRAVVAPTDARWFDYLRSVAQGGRLDEVNFWRPLAQSGFNALKPGEPFFFRLKHPVNAVAGYGFYVQFALLPIDIAWQAFGMRNGDVSIGRFIARIAEYRRETPAEVALGKRPLACILLREARFLEESEWLPWDRSMDWSPNLMTYKSYDLSTGSGLALAGLLHNGKPVELVSEFQLMAEDARLQEQALLAVREGQGSFRVRVLSAYRWRCAITGERSLPVLDAAHIQPYLGPASNHLQNGLTLRADIHRLFDSGYVTITPDYRFEVSQRLRDDFENGGDYYRLRGSPLVALPADPLKQPNRQALDWHNTKVFRG
jgi:putative restriction endonuclease